MTKWEKCKVSDLKEGDVVKVCGIESDFWQEAMDDRSAVSFFRNGENFRFAYLPNDATVKRKVAKSPNQNQNGTSSRCAHPRRVSGTCT